MVSGDIRKVGRHELIQRHKVQYNHCVMDLIFSESGHAVWRPHRYNMDLSPTENVWLRGGGGVVCFS
jgi:hypothetical protein